MDMPTVWSSVSEEHGPIADPLSTPAASLEFPKDAEPGVFETTSDDGNESSYGCDLWLMLPNGDVKLLKHYGRDCHEEGLFSQMWPENEQLWDDMEDEKKEVVIPKADWDRHLETWKKNWEQTTKEYFDRQKKEDQVFTPSQTPIDLEDAAKYAVLVLRHRFVDTDKLTSLGEKIAYAALCAATGTELNDEQKELIERHTRNGKIHP